MDNLMSSQVVTIEPKSLTEAEFLKRSLRLRLATSALPEAEKLALEGWLEQLNTAKW
jgi:hypothetical protein